MKPKNTIPLFSSLVTPNSLEMSFLRLKISRSTCTNNTLPLSITLFANAGRGPFRSFVAFPRLTSLFAPAPLLKSPPCPTEPDFHISSPLCEPPINRASINAVPLQLRQTLSRESLSYSYSLHDWATTLIWLFRHGESQPQYRGNSPNSYVIANSIKDL